MKNKRINFEKSKGIILNYWIDKQKKLGLKKSMFNCNVSKWSLEKFLKEGKKAKIIYMKKGRYYLIE